MTRDTPCVLEEEGTAGSSFPGGGKEVPPKGLCSPGLTTRGVQKRGPTAKGNIPFFNKNAEIQIVM